MILRTAAAMLLLSAGLASAQIELYAVDFPGNLYRINQVTAGSSLVGFTGFDRLNGAAADASGMIYASRFRNTANTADQNQLIRIDPATGLGTLVAGYGTGNDLRALAFRDGVLYAIREGSIDDLVTIDTTSGAVTLVGPTGRSDIQGLTADQNGQLYGVGVTGAGGTLLSIDRTTGAATVINAAMGAGGDLQTIEWFEGSTAWLGRTNLRTVDLTTGITTVIGTMSISDIRGLAAVGQSAPGCYANCDGSLVEPILNVDDFTCFINEFAAASNLPHAQQVSHYANCDQSLIMPVLNVDDFTCFINAFAQGCR
jgi:hypothetical protein